MEGVKGGRRMKGVGMEGKEDGWEKV